jgi:hypothetical protein
VHSGLGFYSRSQAALPAAVDARRCASKRSLMQRTNFVKRDFAMQNKDAIYFLTHYFQSLK